MKNFFEDVWQDLREKRLWPVAALLAVALVALPFVMAKKRENPPPLAAVSAKPEQIPALESISEETPVSSTLSSFKAKDPFKPDMPQLKSITDSGATGLGTEASAPAPSAPGGSATQSATSAGSGGGGGSGGSGGSNSGGGGGGGSTPSKPAPTKSVSYSYVADVTFGRAGSERRYRGLRRLSMLPSSGSPLLVFLGATGSGGDAVFLVDSGLRQAGEGSCADEACSVLSIGPGSEHRFQDDNNREYVLVINGIRRVKVGGASSSSNKNASTSSRAPRTREERDQRRRGLLSALLVDTETVTSGVSSSPKNKGR